MAPTTIPLYQGEDWAQQLSYFTDTQQTDPLVFTNPVMDVRDAQGNLLARFDTTGTQLGTIDITGPGVIVLRMGHANTAQLPNGYYNLDIFADVSGVRTAITKRGLIVMTVIARITQDPT